MINLAFIGDTFSQINIVLKTYFYFKLSKIEFYQDFFNPQEFLLYFLSNELHLLRF